MPDPTNGSGDDSFGGDYTGWGDGVISLSDGSMGIGRLGATFNFPDGLFRWTGGSLGGGVTNLGVLTVSGPATKQQRGALANDGLIVQEGTGPLQLSARLTNQADGFYDLQTDASLTGSSGAVTNVGYFRKSGGDGVSTVQPTFTNNGVLEIDSGTLAFSHSLTQMAGAIYRWGTLTVAGTLDIRAGSLDGQGVINGNVRNAGVLDAGWAGWFGSLVINGTYTQAATGVLNVEVGSVDGAAAGDYLSVSGKATLAGTLNVVQLTDEVPTPDESFRVLDFGSRAGAFTAVNVPDLGGSAYLAAAYDDNGLTLWVVPT